MLKTQNIGEMDVRKGVLMIMDKGCSIKKLPPYILFKLNTDDKTYFFNIHSEDTREHKSGYNL